MTHFAIVTAETGGDTAAKPAEANVARMKSLLDPTFRYRPSHATDIRKTFERVREELQRASAERRVVNLKPAAQSRKEKS